jgi:hypothetical protein
MGWQKYGSWIQEQLFPGIYFSYTVCAIVTVTIPQYNLPPVKNFLLRGDPLPLPRANRI